MNKSYHLSNLISLLVLAVLIGGSAYYAYANRPCAQTIYYKIGTFNTQFGISQSDFLADAQQAASLWNNEAGHALLAYSAENSSGVTTGTMPLNLIYDTRQQQTNIGESISQQEDALGTEKAQVATLQSQYDAAKQQYESDQAAGKDIPTLNSEAASLNTLAAQIQSQVDALNAKIDVVNANANAFNSQAGTNFEEGEFVEAYGSSHIDLYEFKNNTQLIRLMAHEFGHSLGLDHNTNPDAIMYPENIATNLSLSTEDKAELQARCAVTLQNLNPFQNVSLSSF
jgi:predicted Zn-dependent protease